jgi:two-component system chemotaxis response regulator CheY
MTSSLVLIVDDDPLVREILRDMLECFDCEVVEADNGADGLERFRADAPRLTITDMVLPGAPGFDVITEMRAARPDAKIIAVSGGGARDGKSYLDIALESGASDTLQKPIRIEDVERLVEMFVHQA